MYQSLVNCLDDWQLSVVRSSNFKAWFGDFENDFKSASKVVDKNGLPLILFHGTNSNISEFDTKKTSKIGIGSGLGAFFTSDINCANEYSCEDGANIIPVFLSIKNPRIINDYYGIDGIHHIAFDYKSLQKYGKTINELEHSEFESDHKKVISICNYFSNNPLSSDYFTCMNSKVRKILIKMGYDGIILIGDKQCNSKNDIVAIAFNPNQIKSSIGNNWNIVGTNNGIVFSHV